MNSEFVQISNHSLSERSSKVIFHQSRVSKLLYKETLWALSFGPRRSHCCLSGGVWPTLTLICFYLWLRVWSRETWGCFGMLVDALALADSFKNRICIFRPPAENAESFSIPFLPAANNFSTAVIFHGPLCRDPPYCKYSTCCRWIQRGFFRVFQVSASDNGSTGSVWDLV